MFRILKQQKFFNVRSLSTSRYRNTNNYDGPCIEEVKLLQKHHVAPCHKPIYKQPILIHRGHMQYLYDANGKEYLDCYGGIVTVSVGHCHPYVVEAVERQLRKIWHTTVIYMNPSLNIYSQKLTSKLPGDLKVAYLVNSGSEANDLALLLARLYTGNYEMLSIQNCYHGMSLGTMGLTSSSNWRFPIPSVNHGIHHVKNPNPYNGRWGGAACRTSPVQTDRECECFDGKCKATSNYIEELEDVFKYSIPKEKCAGMIAESIQGVGGTVQFTKGYLKEAATLVRLNNGLFISDEVQTGFGRTGDHFWGFESQDFVPDIVTMAKGIGNGFPLAAVVTTPKIAQCLTQSSHFNTFGGNPLACAAGLAVLEVIEKEGLQQNSKDVGTYFLKSLNQLRDIHEVVGDVRGQIIKLLSPFQRSQGLMIGVEFVESKETRVPLSKNQFEQIWNCTKDYGVLFGCGGYYGNVMRIKPPMCITKKNVDFAIEAMHCAIKSIKQ
ncbi:alanine--glyoxylate aminotransferase 2, mitochondrial isoform X3 [Sitodiplosis mosellana]|uniref:alanine--glyoxylate aminotransferase 2, mitochondrial isoform X3 n=1 Tax=Sitodiplosis mosellana TaxID=263140 RepID=UPI002444CF7D|nr:alanine--glyoxylate aminotransferase 2, mitochondrial isoform X3 [Sitodiplosis mosellana]